MSFQKWTEVKRTRKDHNCHGCLEVIPKQSKAIYSAGVFDGYFYGCYYCMDCNQFLDDNPRYFEDGIYPGDISEARKEMFR